MRCELCEREVSRVTIHHLIPRQKNGGKGPTARICSACHRQLHHIFENTTLARELNTLEKIRQHPEMQRFLNWVRKQDPDRRIRVRRKKPRM
ncbi:MAG: HNH endonuclease [Calditrichaeota bacterium]|nr:HNH endonuclease [Calditrichota bacterium]